MSEAEARRRLKLLMIIAASGIVALIAVGLGIFFFGGSKGEKTSLPAAMRTAGCTLTNPESLGRDHIGGQDPAAVKTPKYNSVPPTSGPHYGTTAIWNIYDAPVLDVQAVHNLEHGGIVIRYGDRVPRAEVEKIAAFYEEDTEGMLVAPLPKLGDKIALTAWTHLATCSRFDETGFAAFRDEYRFKGPERVPASALQRGT